MAKSDEAGTPTSQERSLFLLLHESGDALEAASPPFDAAAGAARLREAAWAHGLLRPGDIPDNDLAVPGASLEEEAPPFDVEAGAARLREAAHTRGLLSGSALKASGEMASRTRKQYRQQAATVSEDCPVRWAGRQALVALPEDIDVSNAGQIREELLSVINRGAEALIVDMTTTISCDHAGADAVARAYQRAVVSGTELRLVVTSGVVLRMLVMTGVGRLVPVYPSVEAALAARSSAASAALRKGGGPVGPGPGRAGRGPCR